MKFKVIEKRYSYDTKEYCELFKQYIKKHFKTKEDMEQRIHIHALDFASMHNLKLVVDAETGDILFDATNGES